MRQERKGERALLVEWLVRWRVGAGSSRSEWNLRRQYNAMAIGDLRALKKKIQTTEDAMTKRGEHLILDRVSSSGYDRSREIDHYAPGATFRVEAGAPGIGSTFYRVTRIDARGLWGVLERSTVRELQPWEVI